MYSFSAGISVSRHVLLVTYPRTGPPCDKRYVKAKGVRRIKVPRVRCRLALSLVGFTRPGMFLSDLASIFSEMILTLMIEIF